MTGTNAFSWEEQLQLVQLADSLRYRTVWVPESYSWDAVSQLGAYAQVTRSIQIGTGIINVFSRSPAVIAQTAASLDRISAGRFVLGLGTSGPAVVEGWHGTAYSSGLRRLRETVEIIRTVILRKRLSYDGRVYQVRGGLRLINTPLRDRIPIFIGTISPQGVALAAEIADGWFPAFYSPSAAPLTFGSALEAGRERRPRNLEPLAVCALQLVALSRSSEAEGRQLARPLIAFYVGAMGSGPTNYYQKLFRSYGFEHEVEIIQDWYAKGLKEKGVAAVTDEMVEAVAIVGSPERCRAKLETLAVAGVGEAALQIATGDGRATTMMEAMKQLAPSMT